MERDDSAHRGSPGWVEEITAGDSLLAYVVRSGDDPHETSFFTPPEMTFQAGSVVVPAGDRVARHDHVPVERHIVGTAEAIFVRRGRCEMEVYHLDRQLVSTVELRQGDMVLFVSAAGHGFRALEDTVLFEIKQGPYGGLEEKSRF